MNGEPGNDEAKQTKRKRPAVGSGEIEKIAAAPGTERAPQTEADLQKTEDQADLMPGKNIGDHGTVDWSSGAVSNGVKHGGKINRRQRCAL